jgi:hypothetical protein
MASSTLVGHWVRLPWMWEGAAPGSLGIPLVVWKALPEAWQEPMARLPNIIESEESWPQEWHHAYATMIPKAAGGPPPPRDQLPITVLDLLYRTWGKEVVLAWTAVLQQSYLGQAALGFHAAAGTLHAIQLLINLIRMQKQRQAPLRLASFDMEKCYDSVPWWAIFGVLRLADVGERIVSCFEALYRLLQHRFRYWQVLPSHG